MWHTNKKVLRVYSTHHSENNWANIESVGWRKVEMGATDGSTNMFMLLSSARASGKNVTVLINSDDKITRAYL